MIVGLDEWLTRIAGSTGVRELGELLGEVLGERGRLLEPCKLSRERVYRLRFELDDGIRSLIVKRLPPDRALRDRLAITRWMPCIGLARHTARLLGVAAERDATGVWHVYQDLGEGTLAPSGSEPEEVRAERIRAAVELIARVHTRFVDHPLLAECRLFGVDLGAGFFAASVADAVRGLEAAHRLDGLETERRRLIGRLLDRLTALRAEGEERTRMLTDLGWPETLQHGDLWNTNVLVAPSGSGLDVRLIDWDHSGIGTAIYDLSALLAQFPAADRPWILDAYRDCVVREGWSWPGEAALQRAAETCELGRYANSLVWRALAALRPQRGTKHEEEAPPDWVFDDLVEIERWFRELTPLVPGPDEKNSEGAS